MIGAHNLSFSTSELRPSQKSVFRPAKYARTATNQPASLPLKCSSPSVQFDNRNRNGATSSSTEPITVSSTKRCMHLLTRKVYLDVIFKRDY